MSEENKEVTKESIVASILEEAGVENQPEDITDKNVYSLKNTPTPSAKELLDQKKARDAAKEADVKTDDKETELIEKDDKVDTSSDLEKGTTDEISDELFDRCVRAGLSSSEIREIGNETVLMNIANRMEKMGNSELSKEQPKKNVKSGPKINLDELNIDEVFDSLDSKLKGLSYDDEDTDFGIDGLKEIFGNLVGFVNEQSKEIEELRELNEQGTFDSQVNGLFASSDKYVGVTSEQRASVKDQMKLLIAGSEQLGKEVEMKDIFDKAVRSVVPLSSLDTSENGKKKEQ